MPLVRVRMIKSCWREQMAYSEANFLYYPYSILRFSCWSRTDSARSYGRLVRCDIPAPRSSSSRL